MTNACGRANYSIHDIVRTNRCMIKAGICNPSGTVGISEKMENSCPSTTLLSVGLLIKLESQGAGGYGGDGLGIDGCNKADAEGM